ncbi:unnamed protein product, partial [Trichogramma brassicae]
MAVSIARKRGTLKGRITSLKGIVADDSVDLVNTSNRFERVTELFKEYESLFESLTDDEIANETDQAKLVEDEYYDLATQIRSLITPNSSNNRTSSSFGMPLGSSTVIERQQLVKLPIANLPQFDGNHETWISFKNTFLSMIDARTDVDDLNKFLYLKDCLKGSAYNKLALYDASADNYAKAWQTLTDEYEKHRVLMAKHYDGIIDMPKLVTATSTGLMKIIDDARQHINMLEALKVKLDRGMIVQLHGFCDASKAGYGACIYVRSTDATGSTLVRLACSKSRVAPLEKKNKNITIPRLELCAAEILVRLYVETDLESIMSINNTIFWSDSTIVLQWLKKDPKTLKTQNILISTYAAPYSLRWCHSSNRLCVTFRKSRLRRIFSRLHRNVVKFTDFPCALNRNNSSGSSKRPLPSPPDSSAEHPHKTICRSRNMLPPMSTLEAMMQRMLEEQMEARAEIRDIDRITPSTFTQTLAHTLHTSQQRVDPLHIHDNESLDLLVNTTTMAIYNTLDVLAPLQKITIRPKARPWVTPELRSAIRSRDRAYRRARRHPTASRIASYKESRSTVRNMLDTAKNKFLRTKIETAHDSSMCWSVLRGLGLLRDSKPSPLLLFSPEELNDHYASVSRGAMPLSEQMVNNAASLPVAADTPIFALRPVTETEILNSINSLRSKGTSVDNIPAKILKLASTSIVATLTAVVNKSIEFSYFPSCWKRAVITPLSKSNSPSTPSDTRPIAQLPKMAKILERIVHGQLLSHLTSNGILDAHQFGFRPEHSTQTAILDLTESIRQAIDKRKVSMIVSFDFSKAFDAIPHSLLIEKLRLVGCALPTLNWFASYLTGRSQAIRLLDGSHSSFATTTAGVLQGCAVADEARADHSRSKTHTPSLSWGPQVSRVCTSVHYTLYSLRYYRHALSRPLRKRLDESMIFATFDYGSSVFYDLNKEQSLQLHRLHNACVRFVYGTIPHRAHVTPYRLALGWLSAQRRRDYNIIVLAINVISRQSPKPLSGLFTFRANRLLHRAARRQPPQTFEFRDQNILISTYAAPYSLRWCHSSNRLCVTFRKIAFTTTYLLEIASKNVVKFTDFPCALSIEIKTFEFRPKYSNLNIRGSILIEMVSLIQSIVCDISKSRLRRIFSRLHRNVVKFTDFPCALNRN